MKGGQGLPEKYEPWNSAMPAWEDTLSKKDAWKIISSDKIIAKAILSRTLLFIAMFIIWRFHQKYFIDIGLSVWALGIAWSIIHICAFFYSQNIEKFLRRGDLNLEINFLNNLVIVFVWMLLFGVLFLPNPLLLLCIFVLLDVTELFRWPLYAEFYNRRSKSFNRATTLSLSNFFKKSKIKTSLFLDSISEEIQNKNFPIP